MVLMCIQLKNINVKDEYEVTDGFKVIHLFSISYNGFITLKENMELF